MNNATLDIENFPALIDYLIRQGSISGEGRCRCTILTGGVSNRTVKVEPENGEPFVVKQALERLRVATEWHCDPARIWREALGIRVLAEIAPAGTVPGLLFEDRNVYLLGMEAVSEPHENWKTMLLRGALHPEHVRQFGDLLGTIHRRGAKRAAELRPLLRGRSFFEALRVAPYYRHTAEQQLAAAPFIAGLIAEMESIAATVVHGDYSPKNILVHTGKLVLLDHEVIHFGDPAFDLGFSLTHFLSKAHHLAAYCELFLDAAQSYYESYRAAALPDGAFESRAVRHTLACLLARVDGKSPLEYLTPEERARQRQGALELMGQPPLTIQELIEKWAAVLSAR